MSRPTELYRVYDRKGALLYVGITWNFPERRRDHRKEKPWWSLVDESRTERVTFASGAAAAAAEEAAIRSEAPRYNISGVHSKYNLGGPAAREALAARRASSVDPIDYADGELVRARMHTPWVAAFVREVDVAARQVRVATVGTGHERWLPADRVKRYKRVPREVEQAVRRIRDRG